MWCLGILLIVLSPSPSFASSVEPPKMAALNVDTNFVEPGDVTLGYLHGLSFPSSDGYCHPSLRFISSFQGQQSVLFAVERINNDTAILPNVTLGVAFVDHCFSLKALIARGLQFTPPVNTTGAPLKFPFGDRYKVAGVIGPGSSVTTEIFSHVTNLYEIPIVGFRASSDSLSNKDIYPYVFRVLPPDRFYSRVLMSILLHFQWSYSYFLYEDSTFGFSAYKQIKLLTRDAGYCLAEAIMVSRQFSDEDYELVVRKLASDQRARVVMLGLQPSMFIRILSVVERWNLAGHFIWVTSSLYTVEGLGRHVETALGGFRINYAFDRDPPLESHMKALSLLRYPNNYLLNLTMMHYFNCQGLCQNYTLSDIPNYKFYLQTQRFTDAVYAYAHALHALINSECPEAFSDKSVLDDCVHPYKVIPYLKFISVNTPTRSFRFNEYGEVPSDFVISQFQVEDGGYVLKEIGRWRYADEAIEMVHNAITWSGIAMGQESSQFPEQVPESICGKPCEPGEVYIQGELPCCWDCYRCRNNEIVTNNGTRCSTCEPLTWPNLTSFLSCIHIEPTFLTWPDPYAIALVSLAAVGLLLSVILFMTVVRCRSRRVVKGATWELLLIILLGLMVSFLNVFTYVVKPLSEVCLFSTVGFSMSSNLIFGPLLVKTNRVHQVFLASSKLSRKVFLGSLNSQLACTGFISLLQAGITYVSIYFWPPIALQGMPVHTEKYTELECNVTVVSLAVNLSLNLLLMLLCSGFAFATRRLPDNFNESWYIFLSVSATLFIWIAFLPTYFNAFYAYHKAALLALALILNNLAVLLCLFGPKCYALIYLEDEEIKISDFQGERRPAIPRTKNLTFPNR